MSRTSLIFLAAIFVLFALSLLIVLRKPASPVLPPETVLSAQENSGGEVDIKATPLILKAGEKPQFEIEFNTHSVELDFDISQIASLTDEKLNAYTSSTWEGSPPGGHHRKGILTFSSPLKSTSSVNLILRDISGIAARQFSWTI
ncbi:MAG TPA: hypothetical protein VI791_00955 [Patescibacteria group bacterium]|nr:hypothetical protein [Patescibacteria group bacterium]